MTDNKTRPVTPTSDNKTKAFAGMEIQEDVLKLRIENKALYEIIEELEAQILQWHEIEGNVSPKREISKKYMPKNKEKVLLKYHFSGDDEVHISDGYYDAYDFEFHIANNPKYRIVCVIAWCEISKFEE